MKRFFFNQRTKLSDLIEALESVRRVHGDVKISYGVVFRPPIKVVDFSAASIAIPDVLNMDGELNFILDLDTKN